MPGFIVFIIILFLIVLGSLIPAFLSKVLMSIMFGAPCVFGMILLATVLGVLFTVAAYLGIFWITQGSLELQKLENIEAEMTGAENALLWLFGFMLQVLILTFTAPDQNMELIAGWKWAVVLVLQYVVIFVIVIVIAFLLASGGVAIEPQR